MAFDLQDVVNDPDLAESFTILRNSGKFALGGWKADLPQEIVAWGVVTVANAKQLDMVPEADRVMDSRMFFCEIPLYVTSEVQGITSDVLLWNDTKYRIMSVSEFQNRGGYYCAVAVRMLGS